MTITSSTPGTVTNTTGSLADQRRYRAAGKRPDHRGFRFGTDACEDDRARDDCRGGTATLTITLGNGNATPLTLSAAFTDTMPAGVTTTSGNTGTCSGVSVTSTTITMANGGTIPPGGCTIVVTITSSTAGTVTNTTGPLSTSAGGAPPASAPITVTGGGVSLAKAIAPGVIAQDGKATLTITLGNATGAPVVLTAPFTDPMPAGLTATGGNTGTCTGVTMTPALITMATGSSIPAGGCTIVVSVTSSSLGPVTNVTSALQTTGGNAPPATAPVNVVTPLDPSVPIPVDSPVALLLLAAFLALFGAGRLQLQRRR